MDSTTFLHAITFLLSPLASHYPAPVLDALHLALLSSLSRLDIATQPQKLLLSPTAPPPTVIAYALQTLQAFPAEYRVHWADWMMLLGNGNTLILAIITGCVQLTIRDTHTGQVSNKLIWSAALQNRTPSPWGSAARSRSSANSSSGDSTADSESSRASSPVVVEDIAVGAAENVLNEEDEDDMVYAHQPSFRAVPMVGAKPKPAPGSQSLSAAAPEWFPPQAAARNVVHARAPSFPSPTRLGPVGAKRAAYQAHSRSSSRSSTMSSAPSLVSTYSSSSSNAAALASSLASLSIRSKTPSASSTITSHSTGGSLSVAGSGSTSSSSSGSPVPPSPTPSDLSESADATFYLDQSKDQQAVTEYECGKVGVLTGAVMLGVPKGPKVVKVVGAQKAPALRRV